MLIPVRSLVLICVVAGAVAACGGASVSPVQPTATVATLTGAWSGPASDTSGPGQLTWVVEQAGDGFSGTLALVDGVTGTEAIGTVSGIVVGTVVRFTMQLPVGALERPFQSCSTAVDGEGTLEGAVLSGTYAGTNSCTGRIGAGRLALSRR
jgi:hypothetical protein